MSEVSPMRWYVNPSWRREKCHSPFLFSWWGNCLTERTLFQRELFEHTSFDTTLYEIVDTPDNADVVFLPYTYNMAVAHMPELLEECAREAKRLNIPLLIDGVGDIEQPISIPNAIVLRYGGYRFSKQANEIIVPAFVDDLLTLFYNGELHIREKKVTPSISFVGWSSLSLLQYIRAYLKSLPIAVRSMWNTQYEATQKGVFFRRRALAALRSVSGIETHFVERPSYSGNSKTASGDMQQLRREFVETIAESDYALDVRGDANASMRLFEILSLGRIPVIVDTERNLPWSDVVDYSSFSLVVDFREIHTLPERLRAFHNALSPEEFQAMQLRARAAYVEHMSPRAMTKHIVAEIRTRL